MGLRRRTGVLAGSLLLAGALLTAPPSPHTGAMAHLTTALGPIAPRPAVLGAPAAPASGHRCEDRAGTWLGMRWKQPYRWRLNTASIPGYLPRDATTAAILSAAATVDAGANDCGLSETLGTSQRLLGGTDRRAGVTGEGGCGRRDGQNVVSFGSLTPGLLAVTCIWWYDKGGASNSIEADILVDDHAATFFATSARPAGCAGSWDLQSTVTHEFGHVFGLGHVTYAEHGTLTMSDGLPDCTTVYRRLGLGDYVTLRAHYGTG